MGEKHTQLRRGKMPEKGALNILFKLRQERVAKKGKT